MLFLVFVILGHIHFIYKRIYITVKPLLCDFMDIQSI